MGATAHMLLAVTLGGCAFDPAGRSSTDGGAADDDAATQAWWDPDYAFRRRLTVTAGPALPYGGYKGYTVRLLDLDTAALITDGRLKGDCADLRVVHFDGAVWTEVDRHLVECGGSDLRFMLRADLEPGSTDQDHYLYFGNPAADPPTALGIDNVYIWFDNARLDRSTDYDRGRLDSWGSTNTWNDDLSWERGQYEYVRADDQVSSYRRHVGERDVYVEAELFHTDCYPSNMATGLVVRGIIAGGTGAAEEADHYYASMRAHQGGCGGGYGFDGDIVGGARDLTVIDGPDPPELGVSAWRSQGLAAWGAEPTHLAFWDLDAAWATRGWPPTSALIAAGEHAPNDHQGAGFAGLWMAQDAGRFRNLLIRRYVEPEPTVVAGLDETR